MHVDYKEAELSVGSNHNVSAATMWRNSITRLLAALALIFLCMQYLYVAWAVDSWSQFQHDARHSGQTSLVGPSHPSLKWIIPFGKNAKIATPIAVSDSGNIYVGVSIANPSSDIDSNHKSHSGVFAFNDKSKLLWISKSKGTVSGSLAIGDDGSIYAMIGSKLTALKKDDGSVRWQLPLDSGSTDSGLTSGIILDDNNGIYIITGEAGNLNAVSSEGKLKWKYDIGKEIENPPVIGADGTIYITSSDLKLYAVSSKGKLKWKRKVSDSEQTMLTPPTIAKDGTIYFGAIKNKGQIDATDNDRPVKQNLYAYRPDGSRKWIYSTGSKEVMMPAIAANGNIICTASSINYAGERVTEIGAAYVHSVKPNGELEWRWRVPDNELVGAPVIDSVGSIYVTSSSGYLNCISKNGTMKWRFGAGGRISIGPKKTIYVGGENKVAAIGEKTFRKPVGSDVDESKSEKTDSTLIVYILPIIGAAGIVLLLWSKLSISKNDDNDDNA